MAERAEAAVIAWMRHQTTAYDRHGHPARIKGERRRVAVDAGRALQGPAGRRAPRQRPRGPDLSTSKRAPSRGGVNSRGGRRVWRLAARTLRPPPFDAPARIPEGTHPSHATPHPPLRWFAAPTLWLAACVSRPCSPRAPPPPRTPRPKLALSGPCARASR
ncbi:DUF2293 domain-containing protein [Nostocoides sp.]